MADQEIIVDVRGTAMAQFAPRDIVRELTDRLMVLHPAAAEVGKGAMVAAAQLCLFLGVNPLPGAGELHIWRNKRTQQVQIYVALPFYKRKGREVAGGVLFDFEPRPMNPAERTRYGIPDRNLAAICRGARRDDVLSLIAQGFNSQDAWKVAARTGYATADPNEPQLEKTGRPAIWTVEKRAEVDLMRKLLPITEKPGEWHTQEVDAWTSIAVPDQGPVPVIDMEDDRDMPLLDGNGNILYGPDEQEEMEYVPPKQATSAPVGQRSASELRAFLWDKAGFSPDDPDYTPDISEQQSKALSSIVSKALQYQGLRSSEVREAARRDLLTWLWNTADIEFFSGTMASATIDWLKMPNSWDFNTDVSSEVASCLVMAAQDAGQLGLPGMEEATSEEG